MRDVTWKSAAGHGLAIALVVGGSLTLISARTVQAQISGPPPSVQSPQRQPPQTAPKQQTQTKRPDAPAAGTSEASMRQRIEQLEEQLVDLQVVVGTVESLARGGGAPAGGGAAYRGGAPMGGGGGLSGPESGRIAALETQVQALTAQLEQMAAQLRAMQAGQPAAAAPRGPSGPAPRSGFGTTTVVPAQDPIANIIAGQEPGAAPAGSPPLRPGGMGSPASRQQYEAAYSSLLQQNYPAAEAGFSEFIQRFPNDELTPNAQFWLGETYFVRGQWDSAAAAFLKVAQSHPSSDKAPDSLAKFAMSMERKGNKPAACRALQELRSRYPEPPAHVKSWETAERRRAGCA